MPCDRNLQAVIPALASSSHWTNIMRALGQPLESNISTTSSHTLHKTPIHGGIVRAALIYENKRASRSARNTYLEEEPPSPPGLGRPTLAFKVTLALYLLQVPPVSFKAARHEVAARDLARDVFLSISHGCIQGGDRGWRGRESAEDRDMTMTTWCRRSYFPGKAGRGGGSVIR